MPSRSLQMSVNLSSGLVAINLGSKRRTRVDLGLKNSRGLRNQDFTICEGEIVTKSRDCLSAGVEMSTYVWLLMECNRYEPAPRKIAYLVSDENPLSTILPRDRPLSISCEPSSNWPR
jgi:hypothetical protein